MVRIIRTQGSQPAPIVQRLLAIYQLFIYSINKPKYTIHLINIDVTVDNYCLYNDCLLCKKSKWGLGKLNLGDWENSRVYITVSNSPHPASAIPLDLFAMPLQSLTSYHIFLSNQPFPFSKLYLTLLVQRSLCSSAARANRRIPQTCLHPCFHLI